MAKGLGQLMGFSLPDNFNYPYLSLSMTEFWRRWHMTLGGWFRDYIYIPLGGNRCGKATTIRNMLVVWLLTGLWHGASWNFILWGSVIFLLMLHREDGAETFTGRLSPNRPSLYDNGHPADLVELCSDGSGTDENYLLRLFPFLAPEKQSLYFAGDFLKYGRIYVLSLTLSLIFITQLPRKLYNSEALF
mgnify:CR=1 FL=1